MSGFLMKREGKVSDEKVGNRMAWKPTCILQYKVFLFAFACVAFYDTKILNRVFVAPNVEKDYYYYNYIW